MDGISPVIRTVEVKPPSYADEESWVFNCVGLVLICVIYGLAFGGTIGPYANARGKTTTDRWSFQVFFRDLPQAEQRLFREMQEGLTEAMPRRAARRSWPTVDEMAADGIPPFAADVLDKAGMRWTLQQDGLVVNYRGIPTSAAADSPEFLVVVQEPDPVTGETPPPPSVVDEEHQLLSDGTLLHATFWKRSPARPTDPGPFGQPEARGWLQIRVTSPFQSPEVR